MESNEEIDELEKASALKDISICRQGKVRHDETAYLRKKC